MPDTPPRDSSLDSSLDRLEPPILPLSATAPGPSAVHLCASADLQERGRAVAFDVLQYRQPARAFALRFDGQVVAYLNRCAHVPTEMDWQEGEFLDGDKKYIMCSIHGAVYDPLSGRCVTGMCGRSGLNKIELQERDGQVYWYPSRDTQPVAPRTSAAASQGHGPSAEK